MTERYPYDFVDATQNGWARVLAMIAAILVTMLGAGLGFARFDHRRSRGG